MNSNFNVNKYITCLILILFVSFAWKESFSDSTLELLNFLKIFGHQAEISISYLKKEIEKNPDNPNLKLVLGSLYLELFLEKESKLDVTLLNKAEEEFKEVIKLKNDESYAYFYLGNIAMLNKANKGKAIEFYKKAILYNKNSWGAYSLLNFVLVGEKRFDEIIKILEDAKKEIKITEDNRDKASSVFHNLALNYLMISDYTNALINATEATKLFPTKEHLHLLGICYFQKKDFQKAIDEFKRGLELDPNDKNVLIGLAVALSEKGEYKEAIEYASKANQLYPDDEEIKIKLEEYKKILKTIQKDGVKK